MAQAKGISSAKTPQANRWVMVLRAVCDAGAALSSAACALFGSGARSLTSVSVLVQIALRMAFKVGSTGALAGKTGADAGKTGADAGKTDGVAGKTGAVGVNCAVPNGVTASGIGGAIKVALTRSTWLRLCRLPPTC